MGGKGVESAAGQARKGHVRHQIANMRPIFALRLSAEFLLEGLLGLQSHAGLDFSPKPNLKPIQVLTASVGTSIGLRFVVPGDSVRTIRLRTSGWSDAVRARAG